MSLCTCWFSVFVALTVYVVGFCIPCFSVVLWWDVVLHFCQYISLHLSPDPCICAGLMYFICLFLFSRPVAVLSAMTKASWCNDISIMLLNLASLLDFGYFRGCAIIGMMAQCTAALLHCIAISFMPHVLSAFLQSWFPLDLILVHFARFLEAINIQFPCKHFQVAYFWALLTDKCWFGTWDV